VIPFNLLKSQFFEGLSESQINHLRLATRLSVLDSFVTYFNIWDFIIPGVDKRILGWDDLPDNLRDITQDLILS